MPLGMEVGLGPGHVLDGDPAPPKRGTAPHQYTAHVCCDQTAGWIKMPLVTKVGLGPGDIASDGAQLPLKGAQPSFSANVYCEETVANRSYC